MDDRRFDRIEPRIRKIIECTYILNDGSKVHSDMGCRKPKSKKHCSAADCHKVQSVERRVQSEENDAGRSPTVPFKSEVPSLLFDGLVFMIFRGTIRYNDKISEKCPPRQLILLEFLDANGGTVDLSYAADQCWGKELDESSTEEDEKTVPLKTVRRAFYKIEALFEQVELPATVTVSTTDGIAKIESRLFD